MQTDDHLNDTDDIVPEIESNDFVQTLDHENDSEDLIPDNEINYVQVDDHEKDTEDLPEGMDPLNVHLRDEDGGWADSFTDNSNV